ncbi:hypothetical protein AJ79_02008 [Helicocarpus griseus UAMH5409]|uniref:endo-1,3(4)-beta-glucanase n=1 Tax=Helicocarpus griseus UAMH5409 TaxID=1447875 RepID=A0A2B7Y557_9EURO|nr:hypothetical protein AJ79_02008 [Helicocarpus griseus UAMH5409]
MRATKLFLLAAMAKFSAGAYVLEDDYQPSNFFDDFEFFDGADPSNAYVTYVDQSKAEEAGMASNDDDFVYLGVDHKNVATGSGRESVRLETKKTYKHGLIVADISHMPGGICGTWPAFWATGASWPEDGEFDIIEGVNRQKENAMALHTSAGCTVENNGLSSGKLVTTDCDVFSPNQPTNQGCLAEAPSSFSYGPEFNAIGGGVYATEWTSEAISIWFFPRFKIPSDIKDGNPNPSSWGKPAAHFTGCDLDKYYKEQKIIFNTAFCGGWASGTWNSDKICTAKASTCEEYVQNNPEAFKEAYWSINYMKVFQDKPGQSPKPSPAPPSTTTTSTSTSSSRQAPPPSTENPPTTTQAPPTTAPYQPPPPPPASEPSAPSPPNDPPAPPSAPAPTAPAPAPTTSSSSTSFSYDPSNLPTCTPPPKPSCVTFTTKTTFVTTITRNPKQAIVPLPQPTPTEYPTNNKYGAGWRRRT